MPSGPLVSIVVAGAGPDPEADGGLDASLASLRAQSHGDLEILVALDPLSAGAVARRHADEDQRVTLRGGGHASTAAARNAAAGSARGSYLGFLRPGDTLPPDALALLVGRLERSGSDFAFGRLVERTPAGGAALDRHPAHGRARSGATLRSFPLAVTDAHEENRLYRSGFWRSAGLAFPERDGAPPPALAAFAAAAAFDVLVEVTCRRTTRGAPVPGAGTAGPGDPEAWLAEQRSMSRRLEGEPLLRKAWAFALCDVQALPLVDDVERADPGRWEALREVLADARACLDQDWWARVRAESRVKVWLALEGRRDDLERFVAHRALDRGNRRTEVVDGRVLARFEPPAGSAALPDDPRGSAALPDEVVEMHARETPLRVHLRALRWLGPERLELGLFAHIEFVDMGDRTPELRVALADRRTGIRVALPAEPVTDPDVNVHVGHRYQDYARGAARVVVDAARVVEAVGPRPPGEPVDLTLQVELSIHGVTRRGTVTSREERGSAGLLGSPVLAPRRVAGSLVAVRRRADGGVALRVAGSSVPQVEDCAVTGRTVTGTLVGAPGTGSGAARLVARRQGGQQAGCPLVPDGKGRAAFTLHLPPAAGGDPSVPAPWTVETVTGDDRRPVAYPAAVPESYLEDPEGGVVVAARTAAGHLQVEEPARTLLVQDLAHRAGGLRVRGHWVGEVPERWRLSLSSRRATVTVSGAGTGRDLDAVVPTVWDEWGLGETPIPIGAYEIELGCPGPAGEDPVTLVPGQALVARLMRSTVGPDLRVIPVRTPAGLGVRLGPPLLDDERGPFAQRTLQEWSRDLVVDGRVVYLQSYTGEWATDSQRAIHDELRRTRPDLTPYWGVASSGTQVPEGGVPVLRYSRDWYRVLGSAGHIVSNIELDHWFAKKPGQRYLQTFHGYPAKSMGIRRWRAKGLTPRSVELELARTSARWDLILTPAPEMDTYYRVEYAYEGPIESAGYPRDDALLASDADDVRRRTRARLGVADEQTVVLYAPTWRDDEAVRARSATMTRHLDLESATARLGSEYVFLMRGHRFHARGADRSPRTARLVDVTDYPEVNDLILAADAAVLDYSSLRFDFALTGRPMLFLVPDLAAYTGPMRGFLFPFEESAPGPLLQDAEEVVAALRDLPGVAERYAGAYALFQRRFNHLQDGHAARRVVRRFFG